MRPPRAAKSRSPIILTAGKRYGQPTLAQRPTPPADEPAEEETTEKPVEPFAEDEPAMESETESPAPSEEEATPGEPAEEMAPTEMPEEKPEEAPETKPGDEMPTVEPSEEPKPLPPRTKPLPQPSKPVTPSPSQRSTLPPSRLPREPAPLPSQQTQPAPARAGSGVITDGQDTYVVDEMFDQDFADECMSCADCCDEYCSPYGPRPHWFQNGWWVTADYLMWWSRGASLPPLVTSGAVGGALNDPNLSILYGNDRVETGLRSGGRLNIGAWLNAEHTWGMGATYLQLQNMATNFNLGSNGDPLLARPFFNTQLGAPDSEVLAQAGISTGGVRARTTDSFVGAEAYLRRVLAYRPGRRIDLLLGWRYLQLTDSLGIDDRTVSTDPNNPQIPLGTTIVGSDNFRATNMFNGVTLGLMSERRNGIWSFNAIGKLAFGDMHQIVQINGSNTVTVPGLSPVTSPGSLLTQPSNIGTYTRDTFGFIPELNLNLGIQITPRLRGTFGYSLIWINRVAQAARQVDLNVDPAQLGGGTGSSPSFHFQENSYWLQGLNFGLNYQF